MLSRREALKKVPAAVLATAGSSLFLPRMASADPDIRYGEGSPNSSLVLRNSLLSDSPVVVESEIVGGRKLVRIKEQGGVVLGKGVRQGNELSVRTAGDLEPESINFANLNRRRLQIDDAPNLNLPTGFAAVTAASAIINGFGSQYRKFFYPNFNSSIFLVDFYDVVTENWVRAGLTPNSPDMNNIKTIFLRMALLEKDMEIKLVEYIGAEAAIAAAAAATLGLWGPLGVGFAIAAALTWQNQHLELLNNLSLEVNALRVILSQHVEVEPSAHPGIDIINIFYGLPN